MKKLAASQIGYPGGQKTVVLSPAKARWLIDNPEQAAETLRGMGYSIPDPVTADDIRAAFGVESKAGVIIDVENIGGES